MKRKFVTDALLQELGIKADSAESVFVERQLLFLRAKLYEVKRGPYQARALMPVTNEDDPGAKTIAYQIMDAVGVAKLISDYSKDFPRVDVFIREEYAPIKGIGDSYGVSVDELRSAAFAKRPLSTMKANAARRAYDQEFERVALLGDAANGLVGMFALPNVTTFNVPAGAATGTTWGNGSGVGAGNKTADEILNDLNSVVSKVRVLTNDNEYIDTILIPIAQHNMIKNKPRSATSDTTILEFFQGNNPGVEVIAVARIAGKGAGATDRMMGYRRDPDVIELPEPLAFMQSAPQLEGREYVTYCEGKMAAPINRLPLACVYADGI